MKLNFHKIILISILAICSSRTFAQDFFIPGTLHSFQIDHGETRQGYVMGEKEDWIRIQLSENSENSIVGVLLKRKSIQNIVPLEWEIWESAEKEKNREALERGWKAMSFLLGLPGTRIGSIGNALADILVNSLVQSSSPQTTLQTLDTSPNFSKWEVNHSSTLQTAQEIYALIEEKSSHSQERNMARLGRLKIWLIQGKNCAVREEADAWIRESVNPPLEAWNILGESLFLEIKKLSKDHPCWEQDRFVKPKMTQLLNRCLDASLIAFVLHPIKEKYVALGLLRSAHIYCIAKNLKLAKQTALDVLTFYPQFQKQAEQILNELK